MLSPQASHSALLNIVKYLFGPPKAPSSAKSSAILSLLDFRAFLEKERYKSDRSGNVFSLAVFPIHNRSLDTEESTANFFGKHLRITDVMGWMENDRLGVFLFDASKQGAQIFIDRLRLVQNAAVMLATPAVYTYPDEASAIFAATTSKRLQERLDIEINAFITYQNQDGNANSIQISTKNISSGGAYFPADQALQIGQEVAIDLYLPLEYIRSLGGKMVLIKAAGKVVRKDTDGVAVAFDNNRMVIPTNGAIPDLTMAQEA
jgi:Tfp pilus assembly protein PilZ